MTNQTLGPASSRELLISAAQQVLAEKGFEAASIKEIAQVAGVNQGLVHYYFGSKEALLTEVAKAFSQQISEEVRQIRQQTAERNLKEVVLALTKARIRERPDIYRLSYELYALGLRRSGLTASVAALLNDVQEGIGETVQTVSDAADAQSLAAIIRACFDGLALQAMLEPDFDLDGAFDTLSRLLEPIMKGD